MKFQNCILKNFEQTHGRTDKPKSILSKVGGIKTSTISARTF